MLPTTAQTLIRWCSAWPTTTSPTPRATWPPGNAYLVHEPCTPPDQLVLEDLGATTLVNARFGTADALAVLQYGEGLGQSTLLACALESSDDDERQRVAELVAAVASWTPANGTSRTGP